MDHERVSRRRLPRAAAVTSAVASLAYLTWRLLFTVHWAAWWLAVPFLLLEVHASLRFALTVFELWGAEEEGLPVHTTLPDLTVAVVIPTYGEGIDVLLPTVAAALALEPAHQTWVLDDGARPDVAELAHQLGAGYIARPDNHELRDHASSAPCGFSRRLYCSLRVSISVAGDGAATMRGTTMTIMIKAVTVAVAIVLLAAACSSGPSDNVDWFAEGVKAAELEIAEDPDSAGFVCMFMLSVNTKSDMEDLAESFGEPMSDDDRLDEDDFSGLDTQSETWGQWATWGEVPDRVIADFIRGTKSVYCSQD
jgi:hypothetical protein